MLFNSYLTCMAFTPYFAGPLLASNPRLFRTNHVKWQKPSKAKTM